MCVRACACVCVCVCVLYCLWGERAGCLDWRHELLCRLSKTVKLKVNCIAQSTWLCYVFRGIVTLNYVELCNSY